MEIVSKLLSLVVSHWYIAILLIPVAAAVIYWYKRRAKQNQGNKVNALVYAHQVKRALAVDKDAVDNALPLSRLFKGKPTLILEEIKQPVETTSAISNANQEGSDSHEAESATPEPAEPKKRKGKRSSVESIPDSGKAKRGRKNKRRRPAKAKV